MQIDQAILKRRSIRKFSTAPIPTEKLKKIIEAASWAPSACDRQAWKFIIITDSKIRRQIVENGGAGFIQDAPLGILVLYENCTDNIEYQDHFQSAAAAIQNMLLTATAMNIGSCWVCLLPVKKYLRQMLNIPFYYDPIAYVALGNYPEEPKERPRQHSFSEIVSWNKFDFAIKFSSLSYFKLKIRRIFRSIYFHLPIFCKKILSPIAKKFIKKF